MYIQGQKIEIPNLATQMYMFIMPESTIYLSHGH